MDKFKGTGGIWHYTPQQSTKNNCIMAQVWPESPKEDYIATINSTDPEEEAIANAKLIAAAPELLAACIEFVRKVECGEARSKRSYKQMKEAINKVL